MLRAVWIWPELIDAAQDLCEQRSRHRHLGQLEHHVAAVADDSGTALKFSVVICYATVPL
jgi:hypothetical protein